MDTFDGNTIDPIASRMKITRLGSQEVFACTACDYSSSYKVLLMQKIL